VTELSVIWRRFFNCCTLCSVGW